MMCIEKNYLILTSGVYCLEGLKSFEIIQTSISGGRNLILYYGGVDKYTINLPYGCEVFSPLKDFLLAQKNS